MINKIFKPDFFEKLPSVLREGTNKLTDNNSKIVFLIGGLGVMSGLLPNLYGVYDGKSVKPNLYVYILGKYGGGKGALNYARQLGQAVHQNKKISQELQIQPESETSGKKLPLLHYIPANISKTGFFELLDNNDGCGTLFETEGDTLADAISQDYGNFSDGLRKGFHHEPISYYRRGGSEYVEVDSPCISVVLSSTFDQLIKLIPDEQNGLFSRFIYYILPPDPKFQNVFENNKSRHEEFFSGLGEKASQIYYKLNDRTTNIEFKLTEHQKNDFLHRFQNFKNYLGKNISSDLVGTVHRLGLQFFRIAMILSLLRAYEDERLGDSVLFCMDKDYHITKDIVKLLLNNSVEVYKQLKENKKSKSDHPVKKKHEQFKQAKKLHDKGESYASIAKQILGKPSKKVTIYRWLNPGKN